MRGTATACCWRRWPTCPARAVARISNRVWARSASLQAPRRCWRAPAAALQTRAANTLGRCGLRRPRSFATGLPHRHSNPARMAVAATCPAARRGTWSCRQQRSTSSGALVARPCLRRRQQRRPAEVWAAAGGGGGDAGGELELPKPRKPGKLEPSYWLSREEAVEAQLKVCCFTGALLANAAHFTCSMCLACERLKTLPVPLPQALKHNNFPTIDHGIETLYRFAGFDPWDRSSCGCNCLFRCCASCTNLLQRRPLLPMLPNCCCLPLDLLPRRLWGQPRPGAGALAGVQPAEIVAALVCPPLFSLLVLHQALALFAAGLPTIKLPTTHCLLPAV